MATKKIVPRANGEGAIGDNTTGIEKYWGGVYTNELNSANAIELAAFNDGLQLKRSTAYVTGQIRFVSGLQAGLYLEATAGGTTGSTDITIPSTVVPNTTTITDGTVTWIVRQLANTASLSQAGERQKSTAYVTDNMASLATLPYGWYLECTTGGTTSASDLVITSPSVGDTVTDGTVVWIIRAINAVATSTRKGLMSAADKDKLDNVNDFAPIIEATTLESGVVVTCTDGDTTVTPTVEGLVYSFKIPSFGNWTVTASKDGVSHSETISVTEIKLYTLTLRHYLLYGYRIKESESDPSTRVEYLYDAVGKTPAHMDYDNSEFDYGDWSNAWFITGNKPCMLKSDGTLDYYLDPNDYTKKEDGTASDVTDESYDGNAMATFPLCWVKRYEDGDYKYVLISSKQVDSTYKAYAHTKSDGTIADTFYWSLYTGSGSTSKARSLSNKTCLISIAGTTALTACTANGSGWWMHTWSQRCLITDLLVLIGKSTDTQTVYGGGSGTLLGSGTLDDKGQFYGYNDYTHQVKVFHVEGYWGNIADSTLGIVNNNNKWYVKMTPENGGYQNTDLTGYTGTDVSIASGYIKTCTLSEYGYLPSANGGSATTYYADQAIPYNGAMHNVGMGGDYAGFSTTQFGAFAFRADQAMTSSPYYGCGLSYI